VEKKNMDFTNRSAQPSAPSPSSNAPASAGSSKKKRDRGRWSRIGIVTIVGLVVVLLVALVAFIGFTGDNSEDKYVDSSKLQAVFLNTGQVYFGNIKALNDKFFVLNNIYYLQQTNANSSANSSASSGTNNNVTLVKLGCELHEPYDQMVINSGQVTFWENLQDNGQVAKAVASFEKQNPNGLKCTDQSSSSSSNSGNAAQNATTSNSSSSSGSNNSSSSSGR
jgi:hypothetical protein